MRRFMIFAMMLCACVMVASAQTKKEQKTAAKALQQQVNALVNEGWIVSPGQLSLLDQQSRANKFQNELDEEGLQKYVTGIGQSIGTNYDAAKMQALEVAKQNIVGKLQTELVGIVENDLSNAQEEQEEAASVAKTVLASKSFINQKLGRVITLMECYRTLPNRNKEVLVMVACNSKVALEAAKTEVKKQLEEQGKKLHEQIDAMTSH